MGIFGMVLEEVCPGYVLVYMRKSLQCCENSLPTESMMMVNLQRILSNHC